jgi:hypothetical protein
MSTTRHMILERDIVQPYFLPFKSKQTSVKSWTHEFDSINSIPHPPLGQMTKIGGKSKVTSHHKNKSGLKVRLMLHGSSANKYQVP